MTRLEKGITLIEASAGTGKTYTLCRIALQLTLEKGISIDRMLAVTFTEAATEELATRLHELYQDCLRQLNTGVLSEPLLEELAGQPEFDLDQAKRALRYSLEVFDEAPISTIHGFCKRALDLVALETQTPLDAELSPVENQLIEQLRNEFLRQRILEASPCLSAALSARKGWDKLLSEVGRETASHPYARVQPEPTAVPIEQLDRQFCEISGLFEQLLAERKTYLPHLKANAKVHNHLSKDDSAMARTARRGSLLPEDLTWLPDFLPENWNKALKKSAPELPTPSVVGNIGTLFEQIEGAFGALAYEYKDWLRTKLDEAKQRANVISFNDLLHLLHRALYHESADAVASLIASRYDAALIDEFQDTDRIQFRIAQRLFGNGDHYLFFIGDPKQSIYRFRGADIYAYLQATQASGLSKIELSSNYRSSPGLVKAVNLIFSNAAAAFLDPRIAFQPALAARDDLSPDFDLDAPFRITQLALPEGAKPVGKGEYRRVLAERAANDFARRLDADPRLRAQDVTFLVNDRNDASALTDALAKRGIASVTRADRSVFQTEEAADMKQLLAALANPGRASLKRGAFLALDRVFTAADLADARSESVTVPFLEFLADWGRDWFGFNFSVAFDNLLAALPEEHVRASLDSERRHSNFAQLAELLSEARDAEELSPSGLLNWLRRMEDADVSQEEAWQTRLSSDEGKPQILTVHKSKGLQFPVVILPFVGLRRIRTEMLAATYHDRNDDLVIDLLPSRDEKIVQQAQRESLAEDIRLLYVALTRAVYQNVVYLCPEEISPHSKTLCSSFAQFFLDSGGDCSTEALSQALRSLSSQSEGALEFTQAPFEAGPFVACHRQAATPATLAEPAPLANRSALPGPERVLSFSALAKRLHSIEDASADFADAPERAHDETPVIGASTPEEELEAADDTALSIFNLPKGARAGDLLHLILERYDFTRPETLAATTREAFETLQFEPREYEPIVAAQIDSIAKAPLEGRFGSFRLADVPKSERLAELEFSYPVRGDTISNLKEALQPSRLGKIPQPWAERLGSVDASLSAALLRGFIDLVLHYDHRFYILDWKSNYLGDRPSDYSQAAMEKAMSEHDYYLQYLLYCVALKRYLAWRFPDEAFEARFGGVFYLFARGITPGKDSGIFFDCPSAELLDALDRSLGT